MAVGGRAPTLGAVMGASAFGCLAVGSLVDETYRRLDGAANCLVFANTDAASGVRNILKMKGAGLEVGPILMGMGNRAHIVTPSITARGLLNMSAIAGTPVAHYS